ncbi:MAG TPA: hypothetical protein VJQ59_07410 [Candidatus Sulfotelmatobacter sp.]|nr:hypothetical protein [Candidatus Sulfotelmatobacter sp.]
MIKSKRVILGLVCGAALVAAVFAFGLFHGYFDHGQFEIKETNWSPSARVAMVAARSDHEALGGLDYFVLIGDRVFSPTELRSAYYSDAVVFAAADNCLSVRWIDSHNLEVMCRDRSLDSRHINVRKRQVGDVEIKYVNIQDGTAAQQ